MSINSINDLWEKICEDCRINNKISEVGLNTWIVDLVPVSTDIIKKFSKNPVKLFQVFRWKLKV